MAKSGTPAQIKAQMKAWGGYDWYGLCAGLTMSICRHFGTVSGDPYPSAFAAYRATDIESKDASKAPVGAIHYWDYTDARGNRYGHVGVDIYGGGTKVLNATHHADEYWGKSAGLGRVSEITTRVGAYLGWSKRYGKAHSVAITGVSKPSGSGTTGSPASSGSSSKGIYQVAVANKGLRLRSKPSLKGAVIATIPDRKVVYTGKKSGGWTQVLRVTLNGKKYTGWVSSAYIRHRSKKTTAALNMRASYPKGRVLLVIPKGKKVTVLDTSTGTDTAPWLLVKYGKRSGWVAEKFIR